MHSAQQWTGHSKDVHHQSTLLHTWQQDYFQLNAGAFCGSLRSFQLGATRLFSERMNRSVYQNGALPRERLAFGLPAEAEGPLRICGAEGSRNDLIVFSGEAGFEFLSPDQFQFLGIEVDLLGSEDPIFSALAQALHYRLTSDSRAIALSPGRRDKLARFLLDVLRGEALDQGQREVPGSLDNFNRGLLGWILDMLSPQGEESPCPGRERNIPRHWDVVAAIRELVVNAPCCPVSVAELVLELGLSRRTLQNACQEALGLSPVQYLRALRLNEARRNLGSDTNVTRVATQFGFWHLGHFSRDFRQMFGDLPSEISRSAARGIRRHPPPARGP